MGAISYLFVLVSLTMTPLDQLRSSLTNHYPHFCFTAECGHTFDIGEIANTFFCPLDGTQFLQQPRPNNLQNHLIKSEMITKANLENHHSLMTICLCFSRILNPGEHLSDGEKKKNLEYEWRKRIGGCDEVQKVPMIDPITRTVIKNPVLALCGHSFDDSTLSLSIPCPFDHSPIAPETVFPDLNTERYIQSLKPSQSSVPDSVRGVFLTLHINTPLFRLGEIAKIVGGVNRFSAYAITVDYDDQTALDETWTLGMLVSDFSPEVTPCLFIKSIPGIDCRAVEHGY